MFANVKIEDDLLFLDENEQTTNEGDDGTDEVVKEIDVFLSPELAQHLYLLQFPLQHDPIDTPSSARIKPQHGMLELEHPLPHAIEVGGRFPDMAHRTFQSHVIPVQTHMCLGKLESSPTGETTSMHLVPLTHTTQMRPSFGHINDARAQNEPASQTENEDMDEDAAAKAENKPLVFQRKESERAAIARKSSYAFKRSSEAAEEWQELTVHGVFSNQHADAIGKVVCPDLSNRVFAEGTDELSFAKSLNYLQARTTNSEQAQATYIGNDLKSVVARLTVLMSKGCPIPYCILKEHFNVVSNEDLLTALATCAVLVRGNFCLHSSFLQLPETLRHARTFILYLLQTRGSIERTKLFEAFEYIRNEVSDSSLLILLQRVGKRRGSEWILNVEDDDDFLSDFPDQDILHGKYWKRQAGRYKNQILIYGKS